MKAPAQAHSICQACINETVDNEDMRNEWVTADSEVASLVLNDDKVMGEPLEEGDVTYTIISDRVIVGKNASVDEFIVCRRYSQTLKPRYSAIQRIARAYLPLDVLPRQGETKETFVARKSQTRWLDEI
jgi:hypothetical protein